MEGNKDRINKEAIHLNGRHPESVLSPSLVRDDAESKKQMNRNCGSTENDISPMEHGDLGRHDELHGKPSESDDSDFENKNPCDENDPTRMKLERLKYLIEQTKDVLKENTYGESTESLFELVELAKYYYCIEATDLFVDQPICKDVENLRQEVDEFMFTVVMTILPKTHTPETEINETDLNMLLQVIDSLCTFAESSVPLSQKLCEKVGLLEILAEAILYDAVFMGGKTTAEKSQLIPRHLVALIYNCSLQHVNQKRIRDVGFSWILRKVMQNKDQLDDDTFMLAMLALAGILDEEESKSLHNDKAYLSILASWLDKAVQHGDRRHGGWSAKELATACRCLARNDASKKLLGMLGMLDSLQTLCEVGDTDEQKEALDALWSLEFSEYNTDQILNKESLIQTLDNLRNCPDERVKTLAEGTLWMLTDKLESSSKQNYQKIGEDLRRIVKQASYSSSEESVTSDKHIMISYNWDNKIAVYRVYEQLVKNGYRVWIDRKDMKGSIIQSIAEGVENAEVMLMCISHRYKLSHYCRAEAVYAFTRKIKIVPLLMESDFKADGWLGLIKGDNLHFDFGHVDYFDQRFPALMKELGKIETDVSNRGKCVDEPDTVAQSEPDTFTTGHGNDVGKMAASNWSPEEVRNWLQEHGCYGELLEKITGKQLLFLKNLKQEAAEFFYNFLNTELHLRDLNSLANFVDALSRL